MILSGAIITGSIIVYLGILHLKSSRVSKSNGDSKLKQNVKVSCNIWDKRRFLNDMALRVVDASKRTFWFYVKQKQLLVLYPKNTVPEKYESHIKTILKKYVFSASLFLAVAFLFEFHPIMILNLLIFPVLLVYREDVRLKNKSDGHREEILSQCPELFYQLSILMSSGLNIDTAMLHIRNNAIEKGGIKYALDKVYFELERGENLVNSVNVVAQNLNIRALNKFSVILKQIIENGMKNASGALIDLSEDTMLELQSEIKQKSEKISSKMMMPLILSLLCIMIMLAVPVILQM